MLAEMMETGMVTAGMTRCADRSEEKVDHHENQQQRDPQRMDHFTDRFAHEHGIIDGETELDIRRERLPHSLQFLLHAVRHIEHVGRRLRDHAQTDAGLAVGPPKAPQILRGQLDVRDFAEPHKIAALAARHDELAEILRGVQARVRAQRELAFERFDAAGGQLDVFRAQRGFDVLHGELARRERLAIQPHTHRVAARAGDAHVRDAVYHRERIDEIPLGVVRHFQLRARIAGEIEPHDGLRGRIDLRHLRRLGFFRKIGDDARHPIAYIVRRGFDVAIETELDRDA